MTTSSLPTDRELYEPAAVSGARRSGSCSARRQSIRRKDPVPRPLSRSVLSSDPLAGSAALSLRIPRALRAELEQVAGASERSLNWLSIRALRAGLRSLATA